MAQLFMVPVPISDAPIEDVLPISVIEKARQLNYFLAENAKSARQFLKKVCHPKPLAELSIVEIGHKPDPKDINNWLQPLEEGHDMGVVSEAGCPGVADPGAQLARRAMELGFQVKPLVGPSSILLALMASGLDGQHFRFSGYLPVKEDEKLKALQKLEKRSAEGDGETQIFIETPYRSNQLLEFLSRNCNPNTLITVACDLTGQNEFIRTKKASDWKKDLPSLPKLPTIFALLAPKFTRTSTAHRKNGR